VDATLILAQLLAILAFVALALAVLVFVRRAARFLAESRDVGRFRRALAEISGGAVTALEGILSPIDGVRRRTLAADTIIEGLGRAAEDVARYTDEARALRGPDPAPAIREGLVGELERAGRAIQMVEHGCTILSAAKSDLRAPEAQTSIKRGYLNLLHAREAVADEASRARAAAQLVPRRRWRAERPGVQDSGLDARM
jgi:hypothetical protein